MRRAEARMLSHAHACATYIDQWHLAFPEAARLLNQTGYYLYDRVLYAQAEPLYQRALAIREKQVGPEHPDIATDLNNLAALYRAQGKYEQAEPLYQRALAIVEKQLGPQHSTTATIRENYNALVRNMRRKDVSVPKNAG